MRSYFSQFGTIIRLRLARNRKTGQSKHYGFIEFEDAEVADIVQRVMDKYLLFGTLLQVRRISPENVKENLFKGSNTRFKKIPWGDIQARGLKMPAERELWDRRILREEQRRDKKKAINEEYEYDFEMPDVKKVKDLPSRAARMEAKDRQALEDLPKEKSTELALVAPEDSTKETEKEQDNKDAIDETKGINVEEKKQKKEKKSKKAKKAKKG
jgi:nucleolar protein 15